MTQVDRDSATTTPPSPPPGLQEAIAEAQAAQAAAEAAQAAAEAAAASIDPSVYAIKGKNKFTDAQDFANAVNVASASTVNLNAMQSNTGILTGAVAITAWTLSNGANRRLLCPAGIPLTYNATTNNLNTGGTNYVTQAGDELEITAYGTTMEVVISRADGQPVTAQNQIQPLSATVTTGAITSTITTNLDFKNESLLPGGKSNRNVSNSGTIPLAASLGFATGVAGRILVLEFFNGGTPVMGWVNANSGLVLDESGNLSPTTISAGATSATTVYSASAVSANSPYRVVGYINATWTSGTGWVLTSVQGAGGLSGGILNTLGVGQTWQNVTVSRASGTTYTNSTGRPIAVTISVGANGTMTVVVAGVTIYNFSSGSSFPSASFVVPNGATYVVTGAFNNWAELRA